MNPKSRLIALLCLLSVFTSCHKDDKEDTLPGMPKIKTILHYMGNKILSKDFEYDGLGRLVKLTYTNGCDNYKYYSDKIIKTTIPTYELKWVDTLLLNEQGLVKYQLNENIAHEYTADGILIKSIQYSYLGKERAVYVYKTSDENTIGYELWNMGSPDPRLLYNYDYEFLPNSTNTIGNENMGMPFFGKQDKNLLSESKTYNKSPEPFIEKFHYEWDSHHRVVKRWNEKYPDEYDLYIYYK